MKRIVIVDDSATVRIMIRFTLEGAGYDVVEAIDGVEALEKLDGFDIHAMVVDVNMPRMGGMEFLRKVRKIPDFRTTPVIMLTTETGEELIEEGREAGASGWMVKPFSPEELINILNKVMS
jgi:two-component system chemotaxis response regulator CheY